MSATLTKRKQSPRKKAQPEIVVLAAQGLSQTAIAEQVGLARQTVAKVMDEQSETIEAVENSFQKRLLSEIEKTISVEQIAKKYASLAIDAKNEAVSAGVLNTLCEYQGVITDRERARIQRATEAPNTQPLFAFNGNVSVNVTLSQGDALNVTPKKET